MTGGRCSGGLGRRLQLGPGGDRILLQQPEIPEFFLKEKQEQPCLRFLAREKGPSTVTHSDHPTNPTFEAGQGVVQVWGGQPGPPKVLPFPLLPTGLIALFTVTHPRPLSRGPRISGVHSLG